MKVIIYSSYNGANGGSSELHLKIDDQDFVVAVTSDTDEGHRKAAIIHAELIYRIKMINPKQEIE